MNTPTTQKLFEIPWNGDENLLSEINRSKLACKVKFVYFPCVKDHGITARAQAQTETEDDFIRIAEYIRSKGFEPCVLMQRDFDINHLDFYFSRGIRYFTVAEDHVAMEIKNRMPNAYLTASITKNLMPEDYVWYSENRADLYDIFILKFNFSRSLPDIRNLPKNLKYGIMPNSLCLWNCRVYLDHWFPSKTKDPNSMIHPHCGNLRENLDNTMVIRPDDLYLFEPYIDSYKLIDRTERTALILNNLEKYSEADITPVNDPEKEKYYSIAYNNFVPVGTALF